jgi:hypothetical protein
MREDEQSISLGDCDAGGWRQARGHLPAVWRERRRAKVDETVVANGISHSRNCIDLRNRMTFYGLTELVCSRK